MNEKDMLYFVTSFALGDGAIASGKIYPYEKTTVKNCHYYLKQISEHSDYVEYQKKILENLGRVTISTIASYVDKRGYSIKEQLSLTTTRLPFFTSIRERFYNNGVKQVDPHYMKLWNVETFAYFYMDNGWVEKTIQKSGKEYVRVGLATHAYSYGDVVLLQNKLKELGFLFDIKRHRQKSGEYKFYLRNSKENAIDFLNKTYKYSLPSFQYKFSIERLAPLYEEEDGDIV